MKLTISFECKGHNEYPVNLTTVYLGTDHIDVIRNHVQCNLSLERINGETSRLIQGRVDINIDEEDARRLGICKESGIQRLYIEDKGLNVVYEMQPYTIKDDETGEILKAGLRWEINYQKTIKYIEELLDKTEPSNNDDD